MSKSNNLTDFLTDVANAIREKKGVSGEINPQNFSEEIKSIKSDPVLVPLSRTYHSNMKETIERFDGTDGFSSVTIEVDVEAGGDAPSLNIQSKTVTIEENKSTEEIIPDVGYDYMSKVVVTTDIPMKKKTVDIFSNGTTEVYPDAEGEGIGQVTINVNVPNQGSDVSIEPVRTVGITENNHTRVISPAVGYDALAGVNVNVNIPLQDKTVEIRETGETLISADATYEGLNSVKVTPKLEDKTTTITENNTYSISASEGNCGIGEHTIIVSVPTGGGGTTPPVVESKDVNFYDYDGTLLHSYTTEEAAARSSLPPTPTPPADMDLSDTVSWNYTLRDIKDQGGMCDVGAVYTRNKPGVTLFLDIPIDNVTLNMGIFGGSTSRYTINWGDDSEETYEYVTTGASHTFNKAGKYKVQYNVINGSIGLGDSSVNIMGDSITSQNALYGSKMLRGVVIGGSCNIETKAFIYCGDMETCIVPSGNSAQYLFSECRSLRALIIPTLGLGIYAAHNCTSLKVVSYPPNKNVGQNTFTGCSALRRFSCPKLQSGNKLMPSSVFSGCLNLRELRIPKQYSTITNSALAQCYGLLKLDMTDYDTAPPSLTNSMMINARCKILVKKSMLEAFKTATNWANYKDYFVGV
jgi:hypothetical protein